MSLVTTVFIGITTGYIGCVDVKSARSGSMYKPMGPAVLAAIQEVEDMCRVLDQSAEVKVGEILYREDDVLRVDSTFFTFFSFALKPGDPKQCLSAPDGVVIDERMAMRLFPGENPLGKVLKIDGVDHLVTSLMDDMPDNSHLRGRIVIPFPGYRTDDDEWGSNDTYMTYFKVASAVEVEVIGEKITDMVGRIFPAFKEFDFKYSLQPLTDIHFSTEFKFDPVAKVSKSLVMLYVFISAVILLIACINFINLFVSASFLRAKAVGVRKAFGATPWRLVVGFYTETFYYVMLAAVLGVALAVAAMPFLNELTHYNLQLDFTVLPIYAFVLGLVVVVTLLAGTFPALYMTRFNTVDTLCGQFKGRKLSFWQKGLTVVLFIASIAVLVSVVVVHRQIDFMIHGDLGFDRGQVVCLQDQGGFAADYEAFRAEMIGHPVITDATMRNGLLTMWTNGNLVRCDGKSEEHLMELCYIEPNYFEVMRMKMVAGQLFVSGQGNVQSSCVLNETAMKVLGGGNMVGDKIGVGSRLFTVVGIVGDAHTKSLHQKLDPQVYFPLDRRREDWNSFYFRVRGDRQEAIGLIEKKWNELNPGIAFEYYFLENIYTIVYDAEIRTGKILGMAMWIVALISVAGLFAMAYYTTQRRLREIGIRKVHGALVGGLLLLLNREFLIWVGVAFLVACPVAYLLMLQWLSGFVQRIEISVWIFLLVGGITLVVALLTVTYQTWSAAHVNAVETLKKE